LKIKEALRTLLFKKKKQKMNQLYTVWGEQLNPEHVLEEYPRPQLKREEFTILNGEWDYCITNKPEWPKHYDGKILVPFSPESVLSGVNRQLMPGEYLWYERAVIIENRKSEYRLILHFGAVDQYSEVYINHKKVKEHMGGYLPFSVDITEAILEGNNLFTVKVKDESDTSYHSRGKQKLKRGGMFYTAQSGIWQTVWMEWVPDLYITSLRITPLLDEGAVRTDIFINDNFCKDISCDVEFQIDLYDDGRWVHTVKSASQFITIPFPDFECWSPENPKLYDMVITAGEDKVESYFAMRKIEVKNGEDGLPRIYLNDAPYFQNGLLDQGYWPEGLYTAPSDAAMIYDITMAKELGFNMLRKHIKIEPLRWYYHCDRLGMLVWQDIVNGGEKYNMFLVGYLPTLFPKLAVKVKDHHYRMLGRKSKEGREEWTIECRDTISLLYNVPSIVIWVPFNEGWGQFDALKIYEMIHEIDATRLIDHASGWFDQNCGDFESIHNYFHPLRVLLNNRPIILSEYGGYACYIKQHSYSHQIYGYRICKTMEDYNQAFHHLMEEDMKSLRDSGLSAAVFTQLSDVEDEVNGLFTYDRKICKVEALK